MNPIEFFLHAYIHGMTPSILLNLCLKLMLISMVILCIKNRNLLGGQIGGVDRRWSNLCGTLVNRIERLMPVYEEQMLAYAKIIQQDIRHQPMLDLARGIPKHMKYQAEQDLVFRDFGSDSALMTLRLQLASLIKRIP